MTNLSVKSSAAQAARHTTRQQPWWRKVWSARSLYLLLAPIFAGMLLFQYYPAAVSFMHSFTKWNGRRTVFVGLFNYRYFFEDPQTVNTWVNAGLLTAFAVAVVLTMPLLTAYFIYRLPNPNHQYFFRILFVLPIIVPGVVVTIVWKWFYADGGAINFILRTLELEGWTRLWLAEWDTALLAVMFVAFPWSSGINMLIYLAGFMSISQEVVDAARVDGAAGVKRFWLVELPQVRGQIKLLSVLTVIAVIQDFYRIKIMTNGGPGFATMVPGLRMYQAYEQLDLGYASTIGVILFAIIFGLTLLNQRLMRGSEEG